MEPIEPHRPVPTHLDASAAIPETLRDRCLDDAYMAVIAHTPVHGSALDMAARDLDRL